MVARGFVDIIRAGCASVRQIGGQHDREGAGYHLFRIVAAVSVSAAP